LNLQTAWPWVVSAGVLAAGTLMGLWRRSATALLIGLAAMILAPTSIVPIVTEIAAERRMYLPLAAVLTLVILAAYEALSWLTRKLQIDVVDPHTPENPAATLCPNALVGVAVVSVLGGLILAATSIQRVGDYRDEITIFTDALQYQPDNLLLNTNLGKALAARGKTEEAIRHYRRVLSLNPNHVMALYNLGNALSTLGRKSEALYCYEKVIRLQPDHPQARNNMGKLLVEMGQADDALATLRRAVELAPDNPRAHLNLGVALLRAGQLDQAMAEFLKALELRPDYPEAHHNLGSIFLSRNQPTQAIAHLEQAVQSKPDYLKAWIKLADGYARIGRSDQASSCLRRAMDLAAASGQHEVMDDLKSKLSRLQSQATEGIR
jgi:tetratricopeptide (TPR) repeat protein